MEFLLGCYAFIVLDLWFLVLMVSCNPIFLKGSSDNSAFPSNFLFGTASSSYQVLLPPFLSYKWEYFEVFLYHSVLFHLCTV